MTCAALFLFLFIRSKGIGKNRFLDDWNYHPGSRFAPDEHRRGGALALARRPRPTPGNYMVERNLFPRFRSTMRFARWSGTHFGAFTQNALAATNSIQWKLFSSVSGPLPQIFSHVLAQPCGWKLRPGALHQRNTLPPSSAPNTWKMSIPTLNHCSRGQSDDCVFRSSKTYCCLSVIS